MTDITAAAASPDEATTEGRTATSDGRSCSSRSRS